MRLDTKHFFLMRVEGGDFPEMVNNAIVHNLCVECDNLPHLIEAAIKGIEDGYRELGLTPPPRSF